MPVIRGGMSSQLLNFIKSWTEIDGVLFSKRPVQAFSLIQLPETGLASAYIAAPALPFSVNIPDHGSPGIQYQPDQIIFSPLGAA